MGTPPTVARAIWAQFSYFLRILRNSQNLSESSKNRQTGSLAADWTRLGGVGLPVAEWGEAEGPERTNVTKITVCYKDAGLVELQRQQLLCRVTIKGWGREIGWS